MKPMKARGAKVSVPSEAGASSSGISRAPLRELEIDFEDFLVAARGVVEKNALTRRDARPAAALRRSGSTL